MAREVKKEEILKAAEKVYRISGFEKATVTDICNAADISRKTFYQRYKNLNELLEDLVEYISRRVLEELDSNKAENAGSLEKLNKIFEMYQQISHIHPVLSTLYRSRFSRWVDWDDISFTEKFDKSIAKKIQSIIVEGQNDGELNKNLNAQNLAKFIVAVSTYIFFLDSTLSFEDSGSDELSETLQTLIKHALEIKKAGPRISIEE